MRRILVRTLLSLGFVGLLLAWRLTTPNFRFVKTQRTLMGTLWTIDVIDHGHPEAAQQATDAAYAELERIDRLMSEWKPQSPISQVNAAAGKTAVAVPAELRELLERSVRYSRATEGTFDVTWRGMGAIWRFDDKFRVPSQKEVEIARQRIDFRKIEIQGDRIFIPAGTNIGLGGIAKGYAIDRAMQVLLQKGFTDALVDGGGDVLVHGANLGEPWRLGIQHPRKERGELLGTIALSDMALVTSGDYERFRFVNGVRYHHIIDPRTGWPATASMSVTVLAPSAELGVVLAKGIFILGGEKGMQLAKSWHVEALVIDSQGQMHQTPGFPHCCGAGY